MPNRNYDTTITIYNCLKAADNPTAKEIWYKTVLHNCFYKSQTAIQISGTTLANSPTWVTRIPVDTDAVYKPYAEWKTLADKTGYFTISENDIIVKGEPTESITGVSPYTATQIVTTYKPDAFKIKSFSDNSKYSGAHFKVGG